MYVEFSLSSYLSVLLFSFSPLLLTPHPLDPNPFNANFANEKAMKKNANITIPCFFYQNIMQRCWFEVLISVVSMSATAYTLKY